jgi:hypothetical protein
MDFGRVVSVARRIRCHDFPLARLCYTITRLYWSASGWESNGPGEMGLSAHLEVLLASAPFRSPSLDADGSLFSLPSDVSG